MLAQQIHERWPLNFRPSRRLGTRRSTWRIAARALVGVAEVLTATDPVPPRCIAAMIEGTVAPAVRLTNRTITAMGRPVAAIEVDGLRPLNGRLLHQRSNTGSSTPSVGQRRRTKRGRGALVPSRRIEGETRPRDNQRTMWVPLTCPDMNSRHFRARAARNCNRGEKTSGTKRFDQKVSFLLTRSHAFRIVSTRMAASFDLRDVRGLLEVATGNEREDGSPLIASTAYADAVDAILAHVHDLRQLQGGRCSEQFLTAVHTAVGQYVERARLLASISVDDAKSAAAAAAG